ncbi:MAG: hypothetical protein ABIH67_00430 [Candidatus Uhrbacteria bacterium]
MPLYTKVELRKRLVGSFEQILSIIDRDEYPIEMAERLLKAQVLFRARMLGDISTTDQAILDPEETKKRIQRQLSTKITETTLPGEAKQYFFVRGICYVGEAFHCFLTNHRMCRVGGLTGLEILALIANELELPEFLNAREYWKPPYWYKSSLAHQLNKPLSHTFDFNKITNSQIYILCHCSSASHLLLQLDKKRVYRVGPFLEWARCLGQRTSTSRPWNPGNLLILQQALRPDSGMRAGVLFPPDYVALTEQPLNWEEIISEAKQGVQKYKKADQLRKIRIKKRWEADSYHH